MTSESIHYTADLDFLESKRKVAENVPIHIEAIRGSIERIESEISENEVRFTKLIELLERQNDLLTSIDHAHYYVKPYSEVLLARILILLFALTIGAFLYFVT
ncbi:hypothetical protein [Aliiroseovarius crassostreae]|uniref:hypothetical protein n=1 Tax=Aliiroseovarius crassostreae TaxID=154981 RepID=UPI0021F9DFFB|nr:hypothetical protein [Aliiroseovarius crassostreae]UWQ05216.1 hypothetical protein K3X22_01715 [Aliiroseovarius crassostreae]